VFDGMDVVVDATVYSLAEGVDATHSASGSGCTRSRMVCIETPPHLAMPDQPGCKSAG
jgi:hypothetical protein